MPRAARLPAGRIRTGFRGEFRPGHLTIVAVAVVALVAAATLFGVLRTSESTATALSDSAASATNPGASPRTPSPISAAPACPAASQVSRDGESYASCNVTLTWPPLPPGPASLTLTTAVINVTLEGVGLSVYGYSTVDCPVLSVSGHEPSGVSSSFLIYPIPDGCVSDQPTVFSSDGTFGATWTGGLGVVLYAEDPRAT